MTEADAIDTILAAPPPCPAEAAARAERIRRRHDLIMQHGLG